MQKSVSSVFLAGFFRREMTWTGIIGPCSVVVVTVGFIDWNKREEAMARTRLLAGRDIT